MRRHRVKIDDDGRIHTPEGTVGWVYETDLGWRALCPDVVDVRDHTRSATVTAFIRAAEISGLLDRPPSRVARAAARNARTP